MNEMMALYKKELRGFVLSPNFLLVCAMVMTVLTWIYPNQLEMFRKRTFFTSLELYESAFDSDRSGVDDEAFC
jgi:hypothetical protein